MSTDALLLIFYVGGALSVSSLASVLEATLLSIRVSEVEPKAREGQRGAILLLDLKQNRLDDAISAILTMNTIAHTVGAALAGAQAAKVFGSAYVGLFSGALTLMVLVCTEIIPKTLGTVYAAQLVGIVGRTIQSLTYLLAPILFLTRFLTRLIAPGGTPPISRSELTALVGMAAREGAIRMQESQVFENVLELEQITVEDVMTPRTVVIMRPAESTLAELVDDTETGSVSRIPLFAEHRDRVLGYCVQRDVLLAAARGADPKTPLSEFLREVTFIPESATLAGALRQFLEGGEHLALAVDEFGGVSGLVTLEDLIETILGVEIVDESDRVADLRHLAVELRDRRLARRQARRASAPASSAGRV